jgi:DNA/RNA endonuclease YhcR with UshA esterase domain
MKKIIFSILLLAVIMISNSYAQDQVSSKEAKDNIGRTLQVKGKVAAIFISEKGNTFINFDEKSPNQTFTVAIFSGKNVDISKIAVGSIVTVYGEIKEYKGKPEIVVESNDQIISVEKE